MLSYNTLGVGGSAVWCLDAGTERRAIDNDGSLAADINRRMSRSTFPSAMVQEIT